MNSPSERLRKLYKAIRRIDKTIEYLHQEFDVHDREVEPVANQLAGARMALENLIISLKKGGAETNRMKT